MILSSPHNKCLAPEIQKCTVLFSKILKKLPMPDVWVAGGSVREALCGDITKTDLDIYTNTGFNIEAIKGHFLSKKIGAKKQYENEAAIHLIMPNGLEVDIVKMVFDNPVKVLESFDFTVCCAAVDKDRTLYYHSEFIFDCCTKQLRFNRIGHPVHTYFRVLKYLAKGYQISTDESLKLIQAIKEHKAPIPIKVTDNFEFTYPTKVQTNIFKGLIDEL